MKDFANQVASGGDALIVERHGFEMGAFISSAEYAAFSRWRCAQRAGKPAEPRAQASPENGTSPPVDAPPIVHAEPILHAEPIGHAEAIIEAPETLPDFIETDELIRIYRATEQGLSAWTERWRRWAFVILRDRARRDKIEIDIAPPGLTSPASRTSRSNPEAAGPA